VEIENAWTSRKFLFSVLCALSISEISEKTKKTKNYAKNGVFIGNL
jgi:hypothetical protein